MIRRPRTLRAQISVLVVLLVTIGILVAGAAATASLRGQLVGRIDAMMARSSTQLRSNPDAAPLGPGQGQGRMQVLGRYYVAILGSDGAVVEVVSDPDVDSDEVPVIDLARISMGVPTSVPGSLRESTWRVLVQAREGGDGLVLIASSLAEVNDTLREQWLFTAGTGLVVAAIAGALGFVLVRRRMHPLSQIAATTESIAGGDLAHRVPEGQGSAEVDHLAMAFNAMIERLERSFTAQQTAQARAQERERAMRRFVADAGHELRTPLTTIRGFAELVRDGTLLGEANISDAVGRIETEATRMGLLIEDLLLMARMDERRPMEVEDVAIAELVRRAWEGLRTLNPDHPCTLEIDEAARTAVVRGDRVGLQQVLDNLVANAVRHTPPGTAITLAVAVRGDHVVATVTDQGPGVAPEHAQRIFERFYRVDPARSRVTGGTGLGLAIAREIVNTHGGALTVRTTVGEGASFVVELPLSE